MHGLMREASRRLLSTLPLWEPHPRGHQIGLFLILIEHRCCKNRYANGTVCETSPHTSVADVARNRQMRQRVIPPDYCIQCLRHMDCGGSIERKIDAIQKPFFFSQQKLGCSRNSRAKTCLLCEFAGRAGEPFSHAWPGGSDAFSAGIAATRRLYGGSDALL